MFLKSIKSNTAKSLVVLGVLFAFTSIPMFAKTDKVFMCQNGKTIEVDDNAVDALLAQGATLGECPAPSVPEFGLLTGVLAGAGSVGSYLLLKKRAASLK